MLRRLAGLSGVFAAGVLLSATQAAPMPSLPDILERVAEYLAGFEKEYARVIAEERYRQTLTEKRVQSLTEKTAVQTVDIRSDILAAPDMGHRWLSFRDVYLVNGRAVRDRDTRLQKIFEAAGANRFEDARRIADEGARFNLGTVSRNVNVPSMPLTFMTSENRARSAFRVAGRELVAGVETVVLEFRETARPTRVRNGAHDLPAHGNFWVEEKSGRIVKASARFEAHDFSSEMAVTFGLIEKLKLWAPVEMTDSSENEKQIIKGVAVYTNYRRFETSVIIK